MTESLLIAEHIDESIILFLASSSVDTVDTGFFKETFEIINPHRSLIKYLINLIQVSVVFLKVRPQFLISTGAGIAVPSMLLSKVLGVRVVFCESFCRVESPSASGKFAYKVSDKFFVHHKKLLAWFPSAEIGKF